MMFEFKANRYAPEGSKPQEANRHMPEEKKYGNYDE